MPLSAANALSIAVAIWRSSFRALMTILTSGRGSDIGRHAIELQRANWPARCPTKGSAIAGDLSPLTLTIGGLALRPERQSQRFGDVGRERVAVVIAGEREAASAAIGPDRPAEAGTL